MLGGLGTRFRPQGLLVFGVGIVCLSADRSTDR